MCGRFGNSIDQDRIQAELQLDRWLGAPHGPRYNIRITQDAPVVLADDSGGFEDDYRWGLIPWYAKEAKEGAKHFNARDDRLTSSALWKRVFPANRALIPATGFYEWHYPPGVTRSRESEPHWIRPADEALWTFAGLYSSWTPKGAPEGDPGISSFTIITTAPNETLKHLHNKPGREPRMPAVIRPEHRARWLDPHAEVEELLELLGPLPDEACAHHPVDRRILAGGDRPECIEPVQEEPDLFGELG